MSRISLFAECRYVECRYAECHYTECRYAENFVTPVARAFNKLTLDKARAYPSRAAYYAYYIDRPWLYEANI